MRPADQTRRRHRHPELGQNLVEHTGRVRVGRCRACSTRAVVCLILSIRPSPDLDIFHRVLTLEAHSRLGAICAMAVGALYPSEHSRAIGTQSDHTVDPRPQRRVPDVVSIRYKVCRPLHSAHPGTASSELSFTAAMSEAMHQDMLQSAAEM